MDANDVKKKFFDVTPPSAPAVQKATIKKRQVIVSDPTESTDESAEATTTQIAADPAKTSKKLTVKHEKIVAPPQPSDTVSTESVEDAPTTATPPPEPTEGEPVDVSATDANSEPPAPPEPIGSDPLPVAKEEPPVEQTPPQPEDTDTPVSQAFTVTDALPEARPALTGTEVQEPKIYDTTAYHVPIKETTHGHGTVSAFVFGAIFAVVTVSGIIYAVLVFAK